MKHSASGREHSVRGNQLLCIVLGVRSQVAGVRGRSPSLQILRKTYVKTLVRHLELALVSDVLVPVSPVKSKNYTFYYIK